jgi:hypothetical protein
MTAMERFSVLIPSLSPKKFDLISCFTDNDDGATVDVYCSNCNGADLPPCIPESRRLVAPRNDSPEYVGWILTTCKERHINIVLPRLTSELELFAANKSLFDAASIKLAVSDLPGLTIANNKTEMYRRYPHLMPEQEVAHTSAEVRDFSLRHGSFCCKLPDSAGSVGFAIVDDDLCDDVTLFHAYGYKHYISLDHLCRIVDNQNHDYILQEYVNGLDYSVSLIADNGIVSHMVGYVGYEMDYSCITYGEILPNLKAYAIAKQIVGDLGLSGIVGIDFILMPDGNVRLLEVNPRMTASLPFVAKAGCNMPYLLCKQLMGYDIHNDGRTVRNGLKMRLHHVAEYFV